MNILLLKADIKAIENANKRVKLMIETLDVRVPIPQLEATMNENTQQL